jgi:hypothetical protein
MSGPDDTPKGFSRAAEELIGDLRQITFREPRQQVKRATRPLTDWVESLLTKYQIGRDSPEQVLRQHWAEIVGPANAHYSHAGQIDPRGRLTILASHAVVRQEIHLHRATILKRIRAYPGCESVKDLQIRAG